jgi:hypothetical protein
MRPFELTVAAVCAALGVRSVVRWLRRPLDSTDPRDHLLLTLFVLTRAGAWFLVAGWFWVIATLQDPTTGETLQGRAVIDALRDGYLWIPTAFIAALAVNLLAGWFLAARARRGAGGGPGAPTPRP